MADAIAVMDVGPDEPRLESLRVALGSRSCSSACPTRAGRVRCVDLDFAAAAHTCVERLVELGHTHISLFGATPAVYDRG